MMFTMAILTAQIALFSKAEITPFKDGRTGAVSIQFDDSMPSQLKNALPALKAHGFRATFFINPGTGHFAANRTVWPSKVVADGHELGNHTLTHKGAKSGMEAEQEIGDCSAYLNHLTRNPRIVAFARPGGVPWVVTPDEQRTILKKHLLCDTPYRVFYQDGPSDITQLAAQALNRKAWIHLGMHGVGGEWLSTSVENLNKLLDYLVKNESEIWTAPTTEVWKYIKECESANQPVISHISAKGFSLSVTLGPKIKDEFGSENVGLFDEPLTVKVPIPSDWKSLSVGSKRLEIHRKGPDAFAFISVVPNKPSITISKN